MRRALVVFFISFISVCFAQGVYQDANHPVYDFLQRMETKLHINYSRLVLPISRMDIAAELLRLDSLKSALNTVEKGELSWHIEEFSDECAVVLKNKANEKSESLASRSWLYHYNDGYFKLSVSPIVGAQLSRQFNSSIAKTWDGAHITSSIGEHWGIMFDFADHSETGNKLDSAKRLTPQTGVIVKGYSKNNIQYSEARGAITYEDKAYSISVGKDWFNWGSGYHSRLILSDKAPSFPYVRLDLHPVDWLHFYYIHGWLNSRVDDSSRSYPTQIKLNDSTYEWRVVERDKYIAAHILEVRPWQGVRVSLGESIIYSDGSPKLGFLIPVVFFRLVDHYYEGAQNNSRGGNGQIFSDLSVSVIKNYNFYLTLFIDEFSLTQFLKGQTGRNQSGFTIGGSAYEPLQIDNLMIRAEYTRILPWVYSNFIQAQTFTSSNYLLGHYIGQNSDQIYLQADYRFRPNLVLRGSFTYTRNGGMGDINDQYKEIQEPFLYGKVRKETILGLELQYEPYHDVFGKLRFESSNVSDQDITRTPLYQIGTFTNIFASIQYGL